MTQLDLISFLPSIFFSLEFFIFCLFFISNYALFGFLSLKSFLFNKIHISYFHVYKLTIVWKTSNKV